MRCGWTRHEAPVNHALAVGKVGFVGQPVAVVVASDPYVAEDAVNLIEMDVEHPPSRWSIQSRQPNRVRPGCTTNSMTTLCFASSAQRLSLPQNP